jgi:hypothetical protein
VQDLASPTGCHAFKAEVVVGAELSKGAFSLLPQLRFAC